MSLRFEPMPIPELSGRPLVDALWGCRARQWSFIIGFIEGYGYSASWKNAKFTGPQSRNEIDGTPFTTFVAAENACKQTYKALRDAA